MAIVLQLLLIALWAPLVNGVIKRTKARLQRRIGPPIWQPYRDLRKLLRKQMVIPDSASVLFHLAPFLHTAATLAAALLIPTFVQSGGDLILMAGLLALARFALALAALEPGSAFGGMGSSREMAVSAFVEPALLLTLGLFFIRTGTTDLGAMADSLAAAGWAVSLPGQMLAAAALLLVTIVETGRVPADNPDTHLELTMIHEGMVLEYSGPYLGLIIWSHDIRQLAMLSLLANLALPALFAPTWLALPLYLAKTLLLGILLALVETATAKVRILKLPDLLMTAVALSVLAMLADMRIGG